MIDINDSNAKHTVHFDPPLTGAQIMAAARAVTERSGDVHHEKKVYDDGWRYEVGRASEHLERGTVIAADRATPLLHAEETYESAVLVHYYLPDAGQVRRTQNATIENIVRSLETFGEDLERQAHADAEAGRGQDRGSQEAAVVVEGSANGQSVQFDRPVTGRELMAAVRASCKDEGYGTKYYESAQDGGSRYVVGQTSGLAYKSLVVAPDGGDGSIDPQRTYTAATVATHALAEPGQRQYPTRHTPQDEAEAVGEFAQSLQQNLRQQYAAAVGLDRGHIARVTEADLSDPGTVTLTQTYDYTQRTNTDIGRS
jgi:hypothetical protein